MSSIAHILLDRGIRVFGYDKNDSKVVRDLQKRGAEISPEPSDKILSEQDYFIYSSAINRKNHPVYRKLEERGIPSFHRSEILQNLFQEKKCVAVAGSHGKTSTTAMVSRILLHAKKDISIMVGGNLPFLQNRGGRSGNSDWAVFEADESDGSFSIYTPRIKLLSNIDRDHLDYYGTEEKLTEAFARFIENKGDSLSIVNLSDPGVRNMLIKTGLKKNILSFSEDDKQIEGIPHYRISIYTNKLIFKEDENSYELSCPFPGRHYLHNAFLAYLACKQIGIETKTSLKALSLYEGVERRLEFLGDWKGVRLYDDYGHHPTEISAVLNSLNILKKEYSSRSIVLFQPHRYTRTKELYREFAESLIKADKIFLLPIYSAGEEAIAGIHTGLIAQRLPTEKTSLLSGKIDEDIQILQKELQKGDIFLSIGAGNVRSWAEKLKLIS